MLKDGTNQAKGNFSTALGYNTIAKGDFSHAEGEGEILQFTVSSVEEVGTGTTFFHVQESTEGLQHGDILYYISGGNETLAHINRISGNTIIVTQRFSPTPIKGDILTVVRGLAYGRNSHSQNAKTVAFGDNSHAEGFLTSVRGFAAHGEGVKTKSDAWASHAEGQETESKGEASHSEGKNTKSNGEASHAEGLGTTAESIASHAEGYGSNSIGYFSHAEGFTTTSKSLASHAEGYMTQTGEYANASHAEGYMTQTTNVFEHAQGRCNLSHQVIPKDLSNPTQEEMGKGTLYSVGIGMPTTEDDPTSAIRMNAHEIMQDGKCFIYGIGGYDGTNPTTAKSVQEVINELVNNASGGGPDWIVKFYTQDDTIIEPIKIDLNDGTWTFTYEDDDEVPTFIKRIQDVPGEDLYIFSNHYNLNDSYIKGPVYKVDNPSSISIFPTDDINITYNYDQNTNEIVIKIRDYTYGGGNIKNVVNDCLYYAISNGINEVYNKNIIKATKANM